MQTNINGGGSGKTANKGSAVNLAVYGEHEHLEREAHNRLGAEDAHCLWFDQDKNLTADEVTDKIDKNRKGLRATDAKFYEFEVCPSADEQRKMFQGCRTDAERERVFQTYIKEQVMEDYAQNFQGYKGKEFHKEDICWAGVIHTDREQRKGPEGNWHAHIVVSHRTADMKNSISPKRNQRAENGGRCQGYFDRKAFQTTMEENFDKRFAYERKREETFAYKLEQKKANHEKYKKPPLPDKREIDKAGLMLWKQKIAEAQERQRAKEEERAKAKAEREKEDAKKAYLRNNTEPLPPFTIEGKEIKDAHVFRGRTDEHLFIVAEINGREYREAIGDLDAKRIQEMGGWRNLSESQIQQLTEVYHRNAILEQENEQKRGLQM